MLPPDDALVEGIRGGEEAALQAFDTHFRPRTELIARQRGLSFEDARDVAQDALLAAVRQIQDGRFRGASKLSTWVISILQRRTADHQRSEHRRPTALAQHADLNALPLLDTLPAHVQDPELAVVVRQLLAQLSPVHRTVLLLRIRGGFAHREIALMLRKKEGTVWRLMSEAQAELARLAETRAAGSEGSRRPRRLTTEKGL